MPTDFDVQIQLKGKDTTARVSRTTDEFPLYYTVTLPDQGAGSAGEPGKAELVFYGTIPGPYDDASTTESEAYFASDSVEDPDFRANISSAIIEHEKQIYPVLVPQT